MTRTSIGFIIHTSALLTIATIFAYIVIYIPLFGRCDSDIRNFLKNSENSILYTLYLLQDYLLPQRYWLIFIPAFIIALMSAIYITLPIYNNQLLDLGEPEQKDNISQMVSFEKIDIYNTIYNILDDNSNFVTDANIDKEYPGVMEIPINKVCEKLYRSK
ncbi:hypothetical protein ACO0RG_000585 [Hanseniaspora osmophila]